MAKSGKKKTSNKAKAPARKSSDAKPAQSRPRSAGKKKVKKSPSADRARSTAGRSSTKKKAGSSDAKPGSSKPSKTAARKKSAKKKSVTSKPAEPGVRKKAASTKKAGSTKESAPAKKASPSKKSTKKAAKSTKSKTKRAPTTKKVRASSSAAAGTSPTAGSTSGRSSKPRKKKVIPSRQAALEAADRDSPATTPEKLGHKPGVLPKVPYASLDVPAASAQGYDPHNNTPPTPAQMRKIKTGLSAKDLRQFRQGLLERRAEIIGDVQGLEAARSGSAGELSHMPLHMADVGSDSYEQEFMLGLMQSERQLIVEIDEALMRIVDGTYGICIETGKPIGRPRLEAKPWAKYCIEVARERERRGMDR